MSYPTADPPVFPKRPLIAALALVGLSLAVAATGRVVGTAPLPAPGSVVKERTLRFEDRWDGAVVVREAGDGRGGQGCETKGLTIHPSSLGAERPPPSSGAPETGR